MNCSILTNKFSACPRCNGKHASDSYFCSECGYRLNTKQESVEASNEGPGTSTDHVNKHSSAVFCSECGNGILDRSLFCCNCGTGTSVDRNPAKTVINDFSDALDSNLTVNIEYRMNSLLQENTDLAAYRIKELPNGELIAVNEKSLEEEELYRNNENMFPVENLQITATVMNVESGKITCHTGEMPERPRSDCSHSIHGKIIKSLSDYKNHMKSQFIARKKKEFIHQNGKRNQYYYYTGKKTARGLLE